MTIDPENPLARPFRLPCGVTLKNRLAKSAMSDSLGDGEGNPTPQQQRLYTRWADGGFALSIIGEVQSTPLFAEKPGNLVLDERSDMDSFARLAIAGRRDASQLWLQLGHAGALAHPPISEPQGPSALSTGELRCSEMSLETIAWLPELFARTAVLAKSLGFGGVQIHAAHGFLLSQFLSPLFNRRDDEYGGDIEARCRIVIEVVDHVRRSVGPHFPIAIKINASDLLEGGLTGEEALRMLSLLDRTSLDLIDISGGTYFPGARSSSDAASSGPYYLDFAARAREVTSITLMSTGGFKTREEAAEAVASGAVDMIGLARAAVLDPGLANRWLTPQGGDPEFPRFASRVPGGVTAWYTMRLTALADGREEEFDTSVEAALSEYEARDAARCEVWRDRFFRS